MTINIRAEVESILGRAMTRREARKFSQLRALGYANPRDIARGLA